MLVKIKCTLPHASELISGIAFEKQEDGSMLSEAVDFDVAARFETISGYELVEADGKTDEELRQELLKEAEKLDLKPHPQMGLKKLIPWMEEAKKVLAEDAARKAAEQNQTA